MRTMSLALVWVAVIVGAGCGGDSPYFSDDEGGARAEGSVFSDHPDELSLPYALGTKVTIDAVNLGDRDVAALRVESTAPSVLSVDKVTPTEDKKRLRAECTARGEGESRVRLLDAGGGLLRQATVTVKSPDRVRVLSHATLRVLGREATSIDPTEVQEARVVTGGKGGYGIVYLKGSERVFGRGVLTVDMPPAAVKIENQTTTGVFTNEWLFVAPTMDGSYALKLRHQQHDLGTLPVVAVPDSAVTGIAIVEEAVKERKDDDKIWLLARASDAMGRTIDGVYSEWTLGGVAQVGDNDTSKTTGDLLRYVFSSKAAKAEVVAKHGTLQAKTDVQAQRAFVADTTYLGCAVGGRRGQSGQRGSTAAALALAAVALVLMVRSRRRG